MILLYVGLGAALGGMARYGFGGWVHGWAGAAFPWGTFAINAIGSLLIGLALGVLEGVPASPETRAFVAVGLLGGFTTFSTYSWETVALLREGEWLRGALYSLGSLGIGLVAVVLGLGAAAFILRTQG